MNKIIAKIKNDKVIENLIVIAEDSPEYVPDGWLPVEEVFPECNNDLEKLEFDKYVTQKKKILKKYKIVKVKTQKEHIDEVNLSLDCETSVLIKKWCSNNGKNESYYLSRGIEFGKEDEEFQEYLTEKKAIIESQSTKKL